MIMGSYILKRLLLIIPTLLGILFLNFLIVQIAPGGPVERMIAQLQGNNIDPTARFTGATSEMRGGGEPSLYQGAEGLSPEMIRDIEKMYGFDQPFWVRFWRMIKMYLGGDLGESYFRGKPVFDLICERLPISISLGLWSTLILYGVSIPLGIRKAYHNGSSFDSWTSFLIIAGYAIPGFLFAILLIILFAGGSFWSFFPLRGLVSPHWDSLSWGGKILDYFWHMALPLLTQVLGGFAALTLLTKNAFLEEISKQYVMTARSKGLTEGRVLFRHVLRNASLVLIAGFPSAFLHLIFTGALLIEIVFSLDGLGLLGFSAAINRDYPIIFGTLFIFTLLGLLLHIVGDLLYMAVDPRINFDRRRG
jgi:microcin C transport system permease protein